MLILSCVWCAQVHSILGFDPGTSMMKAADPKECCRSLVSINICRRGSNQAHAKVLASMKKANWLVQGNGSMSSLHSFALFGNHNSLIFWRVTCATGSGLSYHSIVSSLPWWHSFLSTSLRQWRRGCLMPSTQRPLWILHIIFLDFDSQHWRDFNDTCRSMFIESISAGMLGNPE